MATTAATEELKRIFETIRDERSMYANTATRIGNAFLSLLYYLIDAPFIRNDREDKTPFLLKLLDGAQFGEFVKSINDGKGAGVDKDGNAEVESLAVRTFIECLQYIGSPVFRNGFDGEGWRLAMEDGLAKLEIDELTVRKVMHIFELVIDRIRSVGGQIVVSAANGKIKTVEDTGDAYKIKFEGFNYFEPQDLIRCQTFSRDEELQRGYWVEVSDGTVDYVLIKKSEFEDGHAPQAGDEVVLMGNTGNLCRQNLITISATEDGQPRIDVLNGVHQKNFEGCLRARLGNLDGIKDDWFPADKQPHGDGLYANNAYLRGTFLLATGEDIKTKFEIIEGLIRSSIDSVRNEFTGDSFINNPNFNEGFRHWDTSRDTTLFLFGSKWIWANANVLSEKGDGVYVESDAGRTVVCIRNSSIMQANAELRGKPEIKAEDDKPKEPANVYLSFYYKVVEPGTLTVGFENVNNEGFVIYDTISVNEELEASNGYQRFDVSGLWNGTGDFRLSFTGEIHLYMLVLSEDKIESLEQRYNTLIEQTAEHIRLSAEKFRQIGTSLSEFKITAEQIESKVKSLEDGAVKMQSSITQTGKYIEAIATNFNADGSLNTSGLVLTTDFDSFKDKLKKDYVKVETFAGLFAEAVTADGVARNALIGAFVTKHTDEDGKEWLQSEVNIKADQVTLEGYTTINKNFRIDEEGKLHAVDGEFSGKIEATSGSFCGRGGGYEMILDADKRLFSLKGPDDVMGENDFTPRPGSSVFEYLNLGSFIPIGGIGSDNEATSYQISAQLQLRYPTPLGCRFMKIDPANGVVFGGVIDGVEKTDTLFTPGGIWHIRDLVFDADIFPTDKTYCVRGQVYRSGDTLKIKI